MIAGCHREEMRRYNAMGVSTTMSKRYGTRLANSYRYRYIVMVMVRLPMIQVVISQEVGKLGLGHNL